MGTRRKARKKKKKQTLTFFSSPLGFTLYLFTNALGWSREQVTVYLSRVRKELRDRRKSPYLLIQAVYGRKPAAPG